MIPKSLASAVAAASISALSFGGLGASLFLEASPAQAADFCQCVEYVKRRFGLQGAVGNAKDMIYSLPKLGFRQISSPQNGAVVIMQPSFPGADKTYGHVGVVESIQTSGSQVRITVRSANQIGNVFTELNCYNVSVIGFGTPVIGRGDVSFWVRNDNPPSNIIQVNFSGKAASTGVNIRSAPSLNASIVGRLQPNESVSFNAWTWGDVVNDYWVGTPDARWYRLNYKINGQDAWVASAVINGNAPGSRPMP
jgi:surface antigen